MFDLQVRENKNQTNNDWFLAVALYNLIICAGYDLKYYSILAPSLGSKAIKDVKQFQWMKKVVHNFVDKKLKTSTNNDKLLIAIMATTVTMTRTTAVEANELLLTPTVAAAKQIPALITTNIVCGESLNISPLSCHNNNSTTTTAKAILFFVLPTKAASQKEHRSTTTMALGADKQINTLTITKVNKPAATPVVAAVKRNHLSTPTTLFASPQPIRKDKHVHQNLTTPIAKAMWSNTNDTSFTSVVSDKGSIASINVDKDNNNNEFIINNNLPQKQKCIVKVGRYKDLNNLCLQLSKTNNNDKARALIIEFLSIINKGNSSKTLLEKFEGMTKKIQSKIVCGCVDYLSIKAKNNGNQSVSSNHNMLISVPKPRKIIDRTKAEWRNKYKREKAKIIERILSVLFKGNNKSNSSNSGVGSSSNCIEMHILLYILEQKYNCQVFIISQSNHN